MIFRVAPNSPRAKEIIAEHTAEVSRYNDNAQRLNNAAAHEVMKLKTNRYSNRDDKDRSKSRR
jgi:Skp family chaperone for outer membrane proteins